MDFFSTFAIGKMSVSVTHLLTYRLIHNIFYGIEVICFTKPNIEYIGSKSIRTKILQFPRAVFYSQFNSQSRNSILQSSGVNTSCNSYITYNYSTTQC